MHALIVINLTLYPFKVSALIDHTINIYIVLNMMIQSSCVENVQDNLRE